MEGEGWHWGCAMISIGFRFEVGMHTFAASHVAIGIPSADG